MGVAMSSAVSRLHRNALLLALLVIASACATITRASVFVGNGNLGDSAVPSLSSDGSIVAFYSDSDNLVPGDGNGTRDVFVRNLRSGTTTRVSVDMAGGDSAGAQFSSITANGREV